MINLTPSELPPMMPTRMANSFFKSSRIVGNNIIFGIPLIAFEAAHAGRGEQLPVLGGRLAGLAVTPALTGIASAGLTALIGLPPAAATIGALLIAGYAGYLIEKPLIKTFSYISKAAYHSRSVGFGGDVQDTVSAHKLRQRALRALAGGLPPAKQWLGQEALILHNRI